MILTAKNIYKSYDNLPILKGINLTVKKGEIVSIVGSSGAGKTTLLQILSTLDKPDSGEIELNGTLPFSMNDAKIAQFRNKEIVSADNLATLCELLNCQPGDVLEYEKE